MMKTMYKVIVAMFIMAITAAPAIAANNVDGDTRPGKKEMRMTDRYHDRHVDRNMDRHRDRHASTIEVFSFKVNHRATMKKNVVAAARAIHGVKDVKYNSRTSTMIVAYDSRVTSPRRIKAAVN